MTLLWLFWQILISYCKFLMPRPLKWSILGAHTIILSKNIHKVTKKDYVWLKFLQTRRYIDFIRFLTPIFKRSCCPVFSHNRNWISKPWRISLSSRKRRASFNMWEKFHRKLIKTPLVYQAEPLPPIPHFFMAHNVFWTLW